MASTFSTNLALELIGTGDQAGTWGVTTNTNLGTLVEQAISGYVTQAVSTGADTTITIPNGATGVARNMYIELTGTGGTNTNLIVPSNKKLYFIFNNTSSGQVTVKVSGQTGVSVPNGKKVVLVCNGTDIVNGLNYIADFGTNSFTVTNLTASSGTITNLIATTASVSDASATVLRASSATLTHLSATSASITNLALTSLTISSLSITNVSVASATVSSNLTLSGGTANGVLYLNGSKVATSGSALTFDGTNFSSTGTTTVNSGNSSSVGLVVKGETGNGIRQNFIGQASSGQYNWQIGASIVAAGTFSIIPSTAADGSTFTTAALVATGTGNIGIGTASPAAELNVEKSKSAASVDILLKNTATGGTSNTRLMSYVSGASGGDPKIGVGVTGERDYFWYIDNSDSDKLKLESNGSDLLTVDSSGNVGIGTGSPAGNLHVVGDSLSNTFKLIANTTVSGSDATIFRPADNTMAFSTNGIERVRIDSSGNLGLGVTPDGNNLAKVFQLEQGFTMFGFSNTSYLSANAYYNSGWKYKSTAAAAYYEMSGANGHKWNIAASGTINTAISFTTAMTLDASGALLVGNTTNYGVGSAENNSAQIKGPIVLAANNTGSASNRNWVFQTNAAAAGSFSLAYSSTNTGWPNAAYALVVDSSGNLGVGTTTPDIFGRFYTRSVGFSSSGTTALQINGTTYGTIDLGANGTRILSVTGASTEATISAVANVPLRFETNSAERGRFTAGGYFKASNNGTYNNSTGSFHELYQSSASEPAVVITTPNASYTANSVFIEVARNTTNNSFYALSYYNTGAAAFKFRVADSGDVTNTNGTYAAISDIKLKEDVVDAASQWDDIKNLRVRKYRLKSEPDRVQIGLVAQEAETVSPGLVDEHIDRDAEGNDLGTTTKSVKYSILYMKAVKALQEAMARIEQLEADMAALKASA